MSVGVGAMVVAGTAWGAIFKSLNTKYGLQGEGAGGKCDPSHAEHKLRMVHGDL